MDGSGHFVRRTQQLLKFTAHVVSPSLVLNGFPGTRACDDVDASMARAFEDASEAWALVGASDVCALVDASEAWAFGDHSAARISPIVVRARMSAWSRRGAR